MIYKYLLNARPAGVGAIPSNGIVEIDDNDKEGRYGAVYYNRKLSNDEVREYELKKA